VEDMQGFPRICSFLDIWHYSEGRREYSWYNGLFWGAKEDLPVNYNQTGME